MRNRLALQQKMVQTQRAALDEFESDVIVAGESGTVLLCFKTGGELEDYGEFSPIGN